MPKKRILHAGGSKEAPLAVVGSSGLAGDPQREQVYTPDDAEYTSYRELLKGFLEKFTRWQKLLEANTQEGARVWYGDEGDRSYGTGWRWFDVFSSDNGSIIHPDSPPIEDDPTNRILRVGNEAYLYTNPPHYTARNAFSISPGPAGTHLLTDPEDQKIVRSVHIMVNNYSDLTGSFQSIDFRTERDGYLNQRLSRYEIDNGTLTVRHGDSDYRILTDAMAISLVNTIDKLIPGTTNPIPENGRRTTNEQAAPRLLPVLGRRPAGQK